ncbi:hypothetical protein Trydic_g2195 [Trypoxylus dichotomus]
MLDRDDVIRRRNEYLRTIEKYRNEGRNIAFTDEFWPPLSKVWIDNIVNASLQALIRDLSTDLIPSNRGERYVLIYAGNQNGFVARVKYHFL